MNARMELADFATAAPAVRAALTALSKSVEDSGLEKTLTELLKIRASQIRASPINGCSTAALSACSITSTPRAG